MNFRDAIEAAITRVGSCKELAGRMKVDPSTLSRVRAGEGSLPYDKVDLIIKEAGYTLVPTNHFRDQELAICALSRILDRNSSINSMQN